MTDIQVAFSYSTDPTILALVKEFHIFQVDPTTHARLTSTPLVITSDRIPTIDNPVTVSLATYGPAMIEVFAVDTSGKQGNTTFAPVYAFLPPVTAVAQVTA